MIRAIKAVNGGVQLLSDRKVSEGRIPDRVGWSNTPEGICKLIEIDGGLCDFIHGYKMGVEGPVYDLWKEAVKLYREKTFTSDDN